MIDTANNAYLAAAVGIPMGIAALSTGALFGRLVEAVNDWRDRRAARADARLTAMARHPAGRARPEDVTGWPTW